MAKRYCPKCGGEQFKTILKKGALVSVDEQEQIVLIKEHNKVLGYEKTKMQCANSSCNFSLSFDDLSDEIKKECSVCKKMFSELNDQGVCLICEALESRTDLANASKEELLLKFLKLEQELKLKTSDKIDKKIDDAKSSSKDKESEKNKSEKKTKKAKSKKSEEKLEETEDGLDKEQKDKNENNKDNFLEEGIDGSESLESESSDEVPSFENLDENLFY